MLKYTSIALFAGSCLISSVSADINWGQFIDPSGARNHKALEFTSSGSGSQYTTFSNVNGTGLDLRMTVSGDGFTGAAITTLHYGYSAPKYDYGHQLGTGAPNLGLVFESAFAEKGQTYTVTFEFYNGSERVSINGSNFTIYGIGTASPQEGWQPSWGKQAYRDVVSNISGTFDGDQIVSRHSSLIPTGSDQSDFISVSTGAGISNPNAASSRGIDTNEYGFQQGIYYGTGKDWIHNEQDGNISVVYNAPIDSISFSFGNSDDTNVAQNNHQKQNFGLGGFDFGDVYVAPNNGGGGEVPEPSTYALLIGLGAAGVAIARRRKVKA